MQPHPPSPVVSGSPPGSVPGVRSASNTEIAAAVGLASVLWVIIFLWEPVNFWILMGLGVATLALVGSGLNGWGLPGARLDLGSIALGVAGALVLYGIFWVGNELSRVLFPFAAAEIESVYVRRELAPTWVISLILLFIIGPGEEIFWRGFLQTQLAGRGGALYGYLGATAIYTAVHVIAWNFMLSVAALTGSLFWGWMFMRTGRLAPVIVSHAVWDLLMFVIRPMS